MLVKQHFQAKIAHDCQGCEYSIHLINQVHLALVFYQEGHYTLYNYLTNATYKSVMVEPAQRVINWGRFLVFYFHSKRQVVLVDAMTGILERSFSNQTQNMIPRLIAVGKQEFGVLVQFLHNKYVHLYNEYEQLGQQQCDNIVQQFSQGFLVSYDQTMQSLSYTLLHKKNRIQFRFDAQSTQQKLIMRIFQRSEDQVNLVFIRENNTFFQVFNTRTRESIQILNTLDIFYSLLLYDNIRDTYVFEAWDLLQNKRSKVVSRSLQQKHNCNWTAHTGPLDQSEHIISNAFFERIQSDSPQQVAFNIHKLASARSLTVHLLDKSGTIQSFGKEIVKKTLSVMDY